MNYPKSNEKKHDSIICRILPVAWNGNTIYLDYDNLGPCPECTANCEEMNNIRGQRNLPLLDCSRYQ
jgi:hypothetical protein